MKILIIGGTGLISTSITRELLARGDEVTLVNRGQTAPRFAGEVHVIQSDRNNHAAFARQMQDAGRFDVVIDMVCYTPEQAEHAIRTFAGQTAQFIFCSTVDVYSKPPQRFPVTENESRQAGSDYGRNKVICEDLFFAAGERGDFAATVLRPAHTYSEIGRVVHTFGWETDFLDRVRKGKPLIVHGNGQALWVSCHADDVGHGFVTACGNPITYGKAYHLTGEEWQTWDNYHYAVAEAMGAPRPELIHIPIDLLYQLVPDQTRITLENFQFTNIMDNTAARTDLDFRYTITWQAGVRQMVDWLDAHGQMRSSDDAPYYDRIIDRWRELTAAFKQSFQTA